MCIVLVPYISRISSQWFPLSQPKTYPDIGQNVETFRLANDAIFCYFDVFDPGNEHFHKNAIVNSKIRNDNFGRTSFSWFFHTFHSFFTKNP